MGFSLGYGLLVLEKRKKKNNCEADLVSDPVAAILELGWGPIYVVEVGHTEGKNLFGDTEES